MAERQLKCRIEELVNWHPWFYVEPHVISCAAVLSLYGEPPAIIDVDCTNVESAWLGHSDRFELQVSWSPDTEAKAARWRQTVQRRPLVEMASTALASVLVHHVARLGQLDVTDYGDRTDFRSTTVSCMLEISGTELDAEFGRRHRAKVAQALANPFGWGAYVVVCLFSDRGHRIRFSFHSQEV